MEDPPLWDDALDRYVARGDVPWEERDGRVILAVPKDAGPFTRLASRLLRSPESVSVRLDEAGSATWLLADGTRTGEDIARELAARYGGDGWMARVKTFLTALAARDLLRLSPLPAVALDPWKDFPEATGYRLARCRRCDAAVRIRGPPRAVYQCPGCRRLVRAPS